ncbi:cobalamin biosynthesis protein, partial [Mesorhizobium sp.]
MMIAGIGSRKGVNVQDVLAAIETALEAHGLAMTALSALATASLKQDEQAIFSAGR